MKASTNEKLAINIAVTSIRTVVLFLFVLSFSSSVQSQITFPFTCSPLTVTGDLSSLMVEGIDNFFIRETERTQLGRNLLWNRDFSNEGAFNQSISFQRGLLARYLGVVDPRKKPKLEIMTDDRMLTFTIKTASFVIHAVRWEVLDGLTAEGLLLRPRGKISARIVLIPDADVLPEVLAGLQESNSPGYGVARQLAEAGCEVLVPVLVSRNETFSGNSSLGIFTNQPHREWIYRQGFEVGRHVIGYELQKIFSAIDWLELQNKVEGRNVLIGVAGYGEGGLLALNAAALDTRISSALVSGYFTVREQLWQEPVYRNVFGLLKYFGDAEIAVMSWPRHLVVEQSKAPEVSGPPVSSKGRSGAAPGRLSTPNLIIAKSEWNRAVAMLPADKVNLRWYANGDSTFKKPFSYAGMSAFTKGLEVNFPKKLTSSLKPLVKPGNWVDAGERQERAVRGMEQNVKQVLILSERVRNKNFWQMLKGDTAIQRPVKTDLRKEFWNQIGRLSTPFMPLNPRGRLMQKTDKWTSYEVMLDVWPGVYAWGILLMPNDLKPGEKRPVVVCQHGLEGTPFDVVTTDPNAVNYHFYKGFASLLSDRGYITFAPSNLYRGNDKFRVLQRKANPLGLSLFSIMIGQHQRIVEWLKQQPFIDASRIGFYGLSYGGASAMRIPAVVEDYVLSICSANFNDWVRKVAAIDYPFCYVYTSEYEIPEWDLAHTFNYAEMAGLIAPRPFMVERGHFDNVAVDEWLGYEFAKVRRHYDLLGLPEAIRIEYFNGKHTINGIETFKFLDYYLKDSLDGNKIK
jgi:dienelactone hydrolase